MVDLPRHTVFYDVINYARTTKLSSALAKELPILLANPSDETIQLKQIEILSKIRQDYKIKLKRQV